MTDQHGPNPLLTRAIDDLCAGSDLDAATAEGVLVEIMSGRAGEIETAGFLVALRAKGETAVELAGLARAMRSFATPVRARARGLVDTAGTGGGAPTFNVSTTAALIAAGAGVPVAKHGNRSATSRSGSADLLEALGVRIEMTADEAAESIDTVGFGFMFAPGYHAATRHVVPVRRGLGTRTAFNLLGPLTNPAGARRQVVGVGDRSKLDVMAGALAELGVERALVVASDDGLDELSVSAATAVREVTPGGEVRENVISAADAGLAAHPLGQLGGGSPEENAAITSAILAGERGPHRDLAVLNAAAAILVSDDSGDIASAARRAEDAIDSGAAAGVLERLVSMGRR